VQNTNETKVTKVKINTEWYDDLCRLYQKTKCLELSEASSNLRNILWEQVKGIVHGRVHEFIRERKSVLLLRDRDLSQKLFQESFFIFVKAADIWDTNRKTKFITFLGDILDQEILNIIRLDKYGKDRHYKINNKLKYFTGEEQVHLYDETSKEREDVLIEIKDLMESMPFQNEIERDIIYTLVYGKAGDWGKLQKKSGLKPINFNKLRKLTVEKVKSYILDKSSTKVKDVITEIINEK
jgi:hypothetical protein